MLLHFVSDDKYGYFFPEPSSFEEHWETAQANPSEAHHVSSDFRSVFDWIDVAEAFGESPSDKIWHLIENCDILSPGLLAAGAAVEWNENDGKYAYDNARSAIRLLDEALTDAQGKGWDSVAVSYLQQLLRLEREIGSVDPDELGRAVVLMEQIVDEDDVADIHLGNFADVIQLFIGNPSAVNANKEAGLRAFAICIRETNRLHQRGLFFQERDLIADTIELGDILDANIAGLRRRYTDTYWENADWQSTRGPALEASELISGLQDHVVLEVLSDEEKEKWKDRLRSATQSAARELKREGVTLDSTKQRIQHQQLTNNFIDRFIYIKSVYNTEAALFWLLSHDELVPHYSEETDPEGISEIISRVIFSSQGHLIEFDPEDSDIPPQYAIQASITTSLVVSVFSSLIKRGELFETDLYILLNRLLYFDSDLLWYLTKITTNVFEGRDAEAAHLGAPHLEALLYSLLLREGKDVDALMDDGTGTRTLGSLLPSLEGEVDENFRQYLQYMYNEPVGQQFGGNLRNRITHGLLLPKENNRFISLLILADLLRTLVRLEPERLVSEYGMPAILSLPWVLDGEMFPTVIKAEFDQELPDKDELFEYLDGGMKTVDDIADHFGISFGLAEVAVRILDAQDVVSLDEESAEVQLN